MKMLFLILSILISITGCKLEETTSSDQSNEAAVPYFPIKVTPAEKYTIINSTFKFTITNGVPPYTLSIDSGPGSVSQDGTFEAGPYTGNSYVRIKDSKNQFVVAKIYIQPKLVIGPKNLKMNISSSSTISVAGGVPPYSFYIISGTGNLSYNIFTSSPQAGDVKIGVYDSLGNMDTLDIQTNTPLKSMSPGSVNLNRGENFTLTMQDGFPPYFYRVVSGPGTVSGNSGLYQASGGSGMALIEGYDSIGTKVFTSIFVSAEPLTLNPREHVMQVNKEFQFKASGGLAPYTYSFIFKCGEQPVGEPCGTPIGHVLSSGLYFSPNETGKDIIRVQDSEGSVTYSEVTVNSPLTISPSNKVTIIERNEIFTTTGGVPPYSYTIISGNGTINSQSGSFLAASQPGESVIQVRDKEGSTSTATVTVNAKLAVVPVSSDVSPIKTSVNNSVNIVATGGVPPYIYQIYNQIIYGSISNSGVFYAGAVVPPNNENVIIRVLDSMNSSLDVYIKIAPQLTIVDPNFTITAGAEKKIEATGGVPPYSLKFKNYTISPNGSTIINDELGMHYKAGFVTELKQEIIQVTDAIGNLAETSLSIDAGLRGHFEIMKASGSSILSGNCNTFSAPRTPNSVNTWINLVAGKEPFIFSGCGDSSSSLPNWQPWVGTNSIGDPRALVMDRSVGPLVGIHADLELTQQEESFSSVSIWFYWDKVSRQGSLASGRTKIDGTLIGFDGYKLAFSSGDIRTDISKNYLCFITQSDSNEFDNDCFGMADPDPIISEKWTHIVALFNNSDVKKSKLYINGRAYQLQSLHGSGIAHVLGRKTTNRVSVGSTFYDSSSIPSVSKKITAKFGDIRFYNREITSAEILSLYNKDRGTYQAQPMSVSPTNATIARNSSRDVVITGGTPPFQCKLKSGTGIVTPVADTMVGVCTYTSGNTTGTSIVEITDSFNLKIESIFNVN